MIIIIRKLLVLMILGGNIWFFYACRQEGNKQSPPENLPQKKDLIRFIDSAYIKQYHAPVYFIIVGSYTEEGGARRVCKTLQQKGLEARVIEAAGRWRVAAEKFAYHEDAVDFRNAYNSKNPGTGAWILEVDSMAD